MTPELAQAYPTTAQYARWEDRAETVDMTMSEFVQSMVEAGIKVDKGFDPDIEPDTSDRDLRRQRNELRDELDHARSRIEELESEVYYSEAAELERYVEDNPDCSFPELVDHMRDTVAQRVNRVIDAKGIDVLLDQRTGGLDES
jgi:hypothetical protein